MTTIRCNCGTFGYIRHQASNFFCPRAAISVATPDRLITLAESDWLKALADDPRAVKPHPTEASVSQIEHYCVACGGECRKAR